MESSAALGSLNQTLGSAINSQKVQSLCGNLSASDYSCTQRWRSSSNSNYTLALRAKASKISTATKSDDSSDASLQVPKGKNTVRRTTFPKELEALVHEVCNETEVAVLQIKVGDFEMNLKRKIGETAAPIPVADISPTVAPPIPSEPMNQSGASAPSPTQTKPSSEKVSPFMNTSYGKSSKLAALDASGSNNYVLIKSPSVGNFQRTRTVKGKIQPPTCKEGDAIKEGQVIGYLHQLGTELPVKVKKQLSDEFRRQVSATRLSVSDTQKNNISVAETCRCRQRQSDVAGEILKFLSDDGECVGYGDPLVAILPSFHDINIQ